jgi:hypothetical protein
MMATTTVISRAVAWARGSTIRYDLTVYRARLEGIERHTLEVGTASDERLGRWGDELRARVQAGTRARRGHRRVVRAGT